MLCLVVSAPVHQKGNSPMLAAPARISSVQHTNPNTSWFTTSWHSSTPPHWHSPGVHKSSHTILLFTYWTAGIEPAYCIANTSYTVHMWHARSKEHNLCFMDITFTLKNAFFQRTLLSAYFSVVTTITIFQFISWLWVILKTPRSLSHHIEEMRL